MPPLLTLERGSRFLAVRVVPDSPVPAEEVEKLIAVLENDDYQGGACWCVNGRAVRTGRRLAAGAGPRADTERAGD